MLNTMTTNLFIPAVIEREACPKHKVPKGVPCYHMKKPTFGYWPGVCNKRALRAGFVGTIQPSSLRLKKLS